MANKNLLIAGVGWTSILSTGLNSLADGSSVVASSGIDNSSNLNLFADFSLVLGSLNPSNQAPVELHLLELGGDGTNYDDLTDGTWISNFVLKSGSSAKYAFIRRIQLTLGVFKPAVKNRLGVSWASSGNVLYYRTYAEQNNG